MNRGHVVDFEGKRTRIIEAALKVFAEKGFDGATNREIAREAGITPGLIYWYFRDKEDLFYAALDHRWSVPELEATLAAMRLESPTQALTRIAQLFLSFFDDQENVRVFRMLLGEAGRFPDAGRMLREGVVRRMVAALSAYLVEQAHLGTVRPVDPPMVAQSFLGSLLSFVISRDILGQEILHQVPRSRIISSLVEIYARGLKPDRKTSP